VAALPFEQFEKKYEKRYSSLEERSLRREIYEGNLRFVQNHNLDGTKTYTVGINRFADLTSQEFARLHLQEPREVVVAPSQERVAAPLPTSWDWSAKGAVGPVQNEGQCGGAWIFVTTDAVASCHFITTGKAYEDLSGQQLIDCDSNSEGCDGGLSGDAFQYIKQNGGIDTAACYPYSGVSSPCQWNPDCCGSTVSNIFNVTSGDETALQNAVYLTPVVVGVDASQPSFQMYTGGVYYEPACSSSQLDHEMLAVGWGVNSGAAFWLVKNSWGNDWGQGGFIWMARNKNNNCGIATAAVYVTGCDDCDAY